MLFINRLFSNCINAIRSQRKFRLYHAAKKLELRRSDYMNVLLKPLPRSFKDFGHKKEKMPTHKTVAMVIVMTYMMVVIYGDPIGYIERKGWAIEPDVDNS